MKKSGKLFVLLVAVIVMISSMTILTACNNDVKEYSVTYYDGNDILKTESVKEGEKAVEWTPSKEGYKFEGWFATPDFGHKFDFNAEISENKSVFAQFSSAQQSVDNREFYILGSGTSPILLKSNWGKVIDESTKMVKAEDKNEYTYTIDLQVGDQFQFAIDSSWHNQRGVGYLQETKLSDGTEVFSGASTIGDNSSYRLNIKCEYAGNYTFTLTTHPDDDQYETDNASYTEENKEAFNINPLDSITWVRNGDIEAVQEVITNYYIKGATITDWKDVYNASTKMEENNGVHTLIVYLKKGEQFLFTSLNTVGSEVSVGTEYLKANLLDEASKSYIEGTTGNMTAKESGEYTFTYNKESNVLSVAFNGEYTPAATDYYIDGTFAEGVADWSGYCFQEAYKLVETSEGSGVYELKNVALKADSQIIVQAFKSGATERGEWGTDSYNGLGSYNYTYLVGGGDNFSAVGGGNNNIKVLVAGNYNITFNSYSKILSIEDANVINDAYIVGSMTDSWSALADYKMVYDSEKGSYSITISLKANDEFGIKVMEGKSTNQKYWFGKSNVSEAIEGLDIAGNNIKCTADGSYVITLTVVDGNGTIVLAKA